MSYLSSLTLLFCVQDILDFLRAECGWASRHLLMADCHPTPPLEAELPWFALSHLCPPPCLLTLSPTCLPVLGSYQVLAHLKILVCLIHLCPPPGLLTLPTQGSSTWLAGLGGQFMVVWCSLNVSRCDIPNHAPHAASTALCVFHHPSFSLLLLFVWLCFLGGLGGCDPGHGSWPPAAIVDSFYLHLSCNQCCIWTLTKFVMND